MNDGIFLSVALKVALQLEVLTTYYKMHIKSVSSDLAARIMQFVLCSTCFGLFMPPNLLKINKNL